MKVLIIGGSDTGISTALRIRELDENIKPLVIADNNYPNFSICGIPFYVGGEVKHWQDLAHRTADDIRSKGIDLMLNTKVTVIKPESKQIIVQNNNGEEQTLGYDKLVLGTGAKSVTPPIKGLDLEGVFKMRWMKDCRNFDQYLKQKQPKKGVIIGGGYVGLEMAEAMKNRGLDVTLLELEETILNTVDKPLRKKVKQRLSAQGIKINTGTMVQEIIKQENKLLVTAKGNFEIKADVVVVSAGARPNTGLGQKIGLETGLNQAYKVNQKMETSLSDIYAGGDCTETLNQITGNYTYYALGTVAHKEGRIIGSNICGLERKFDGSLGTQSIKLFDTVVARTGFNEQEARENDFDPITVEITVHDHKVYYPPSYDTIVRVTADKKTGRILGAQILGNINAEISKRIDIFAAAIYNKMDYKNFNQLDLSYTPPLSSPWDPVQQAVQKLEQKL